MIDAIDACSLVAFVRYCLPLDNDSKLFNFMKGKIESKEVVVIDKVYWQCENIAKGIVVKAMPFLKENRVSTADCLPDKKFFNLVDNNFVNRAIKNKLDQKDPLLFQTLKNEFLEDADAKLLLYCLKNKGLLSPRIITEETETSNDNKGFKKIPVLCKIVEIETITITDYLKEKGVI